MDLTPLINSKGQADERVREILRDILNTTPSFEEAVSLSKKYEMPLHPAYLLYWSSLTTAQLLGLLESLKKLKIIKKGEKIYSIIANSQSKRFFELLGCEHIVKKVPFKESKEVEAEILIFGESATNSLLSNVGLEIKNYNQEPLRRRCDELVLYIKENLEKMPLEIINYKNFVEIRDKSGSYIGARMGRPEKSKMRRLGGNPHGLFPIGHGFEISAERKFGEDEVSTKIKQNRLRNIIESVHEGRIQGQFCFYKCSSCSKESLYRTCIFCGNEAKQNYYHKYDGQEVEKEHNMAVSYKSHELDFVPYVKDCRKRLKASELPKLVKGIKGTSNRLKVVEHLLKPFLREKNNVFVNKDGTVRFDMIEMGVTHFKPCEIGTSIEKLKELGYIKDLEGKSITEDTQIIEILPQDVILPDCSLSGDELASEFIINVGNFIDELLEKLYHIKPFYNFKTKEDTLGHLIIGLAPHTSAGIIGRIIGYSKTQGCFANPIWHAAQRRNLDGDENGIMLLLDGLINFSREYLPDRRGTRTMDTSLVLTSHLYLDQIDDEVHGMDIVPFYPLELYRAAKEYKHPKEVSVKSVGSRIGAKREEQYSNYFFTHDVGNVNDTILCSSYKSVPTMAEKMDLQLDIATKIRAVNEHKVGTLIIDKHFMKDIKGNLRRFSMQSFRCTNCNEIYRRPPLSGKCVVCNHSKINFTIHEGSIRKYLSLSFDIIKNYKVDPYIVETLILANLRVESVFGKEKDRQKNLNLFFSA